MSKKKTYPVLLPEEPKKPEFTAEQQAWLKWILTPRCCHVSGMHDPLHFDEDTYICEIQLRQRYEHLLRELGLEKFKPQDACSDPECGWCQDYFPKQQAAEKKAGKSCTPASNVGTSNIKSAKAKRTRNRSSKG